MITFQETKDGYSFFKDRTVIADGCYEDGEFLLIHDNQMNSFANAQQAFVHLKGTYNEHSVPLKQSTIDLFTPGKRIDSSVRARPCAV